MFKKNNKILAIFLAVFLCLFMMPFGINAKASTDQDYFTYGAGLSEAQLSETERLIGLPQDQDIKRLVVKIGRASCRERV